MEHRFIKDYKKQTHLDGVTLKPQRSLILKFGEFSGKKKITECSFFYYLPTPSTVGDIL